MIRCLQKQQLKSLLIIWKDKGILVKVERLDIVVAVIAGIT